MVISLLGSARDLAWRVGAALTPRGASAPTIYARSADDTVARLQEWYRVVQTGDRAGSLRSAYEQTVAVFRCVSLIASSLARIPLEVYSEKREEQMTSGPVVELFGRPNPAMTQQRFVQTVACHGLLEGSAFVLIDEPNSRKRPRALLPIPPQLVSPIRATGDLYNLGGWRVHGGGRIVTLAPEDLARIEYEPDPNDPYRGVSPLGAARLVIDADYEAAQYNRSFLRNGGALAGLLKYKGEGSIPEDKAAQAEKKWQERYGGSGKPGKVAVLSGNFDYQPLSIPQKDMQFIQMRRWNLADIARAFGVPLLFLNEFETGGLSDAGLRTQEALLYRNVVVPYAVKIAQVFTDQIAKRLDPDAIVVFNYDVVEALRADMTAKLGHAQQLAALSYPVNRINEVLDLGLPEVDWGDDALVSAGQITASAAVKYSELPEVPETPAPAPPPERPAAAVSSPVVSPRAASSHERAAIWRKYVRETMPLENRMLGKLRKNLLAQRRLLLDALDAQFDERRSLERAPKKKGDKTQVSISREDEQRAQRVSEAFDVEAFLEAVEPGILTSYTTGAKKGYVDLGIESDDAMDFQAERVPKLALGYYEERMPELFTTGEDIRTVVRDTLLVGLQVGENLSDLKDRVKDAMNGISAKRARVIARTETQIALNGGKFAAYERDHAGREIEWLSAQDEVVRERHRIDGERVTVGEEFSNGLRFPGDPGGDAADVVNCRCTTLPVVEATGPPSPRPDYGEED